MEDRDPLVDDWYRAYAACISCSNGDIRQADLILFRVCGLNHRHRAHHPASDFGDVLHLHRHRHHRLLQDGDVSERRGLQEMNQYDHQLRHRIHLGEDIICAGFQYLLKS